MMTNEGVPRRHQLAGQRGGAIAVTGKLCCCAREVGGGVSLADDLPEVERVDLSDVVVRDVVLAARGVVGVCGGVGDLSIKIGINVQRGACVFGSIE